MIDVGRGKRLRGCMQHSLLENTEPEDTQFDFLPPIKPKEHRND